MAEYLGGGGVTIPAVESTEPHKKVTEIPAPLPTTQPPASNSGSDDPTGGISQDAGGLSSSAGVSSPVPNDTQPQGVVNSVLEYAFGKKERTAEEADAANPTSSTVTTDNKSATNTSYLGGIAAAAVAGGAAVASIIPGMSSSTTTGGDHAPATTEKTLGEQTSEAVESAKTTAADVTESAKETAAEATESAKETANAASEQVKEATGAEEKEEDPQKADEAKKHENYVAAHRENKEAIPTAGGEKLGAAHEGESKVIPENPPVTSEEKSETAAAAQPDSTTSDNTAKNAGGKNRMSILGGKKNGEASPADKPKFMDRVKAKLHIGEKKDKA